jgi:hypothetical protein
MRKLGFSTTLKKKNIIKWSPRGKLYFSLLVLFTIVRDYKRVLLHGVFPHFILTLFFEKNKCFFFVSHNSFFGHS